MTIVINRMWAYRESDLSEQINDRAAAMGAEVLSVSYMGSTDGAIEVLVTFRWLEGK